METIDSSSITSSPGLFLAVTPAIKRVWKPPLVDPPALVPRLAVTPAIRRVWKLGLNILLITSRKIIARYTHHLVFRREVVALLLPDPLGPDVHPSMRQMRNRPFFSRSFGREKPSPMKGFALMDTASASPPARRRCTCTPTSDHGPVQFSQFP